MKTKPLIQSNPPSPRTAGTIRIPRAGMVLLLVLGICFFLLFLVTINTKQAQPNADEEAHLAVEYYLPRVIQNPELASGRFVPPRIIKPSDGLGLYRFQRQREARTRSGAQEEKTTSADRAKEPERVSREAAAEADRVNAQYLEKFRALGESEFKGLSGQGYYKGFKDPSVLVADRTANFGSKEIPVTIYIMSPARYRGWNPPGLEIRNDPRKTGLNTIGMCRFMLEGRWSRGSVTFRGISAYVTYSPNPERLNPPARDYVIAGPVTNETNGHVYYLLEPLSWTASERIARELNGHLVTINDPEEQQWVTKTLPEKAGALAPGGSLWIGLHDPQGDGNFVWVSGEDAEYRNWPPGEPTQNPSERYAAMQGRTDEDPGAWVGWHDEGAEWHPGRIDLVHGVVEVIPEAGPN